MASRTLRLLLATLVGAALTLGTLGTAWAGPATDVKAKQVTLREAPRTTPSRRRKSPAIFDQLLDYDVLAQGSLGSEWAARSDAEKAQFTDLLKQLVRRSYERNLKDAGSNRVRRRGRGIRRRDREDEGQSFRRAPRSRWS